MIPKIHGVGRIGQDIQLQYSKDGKAFAKFGVAFSENEDVVWLTAIAFGKAAENIHQFFKKGDRIELEGRVNINSWVNQKGCTNREMQIIVERFGFIENKSDKSNTKKKKKDKPDDRPPAPALDIDDDEIPF